MGIGTDTQNRYEGFLQIDVCTPLDKGEAEANAKLEWIEKLFQKGTEIDFVNINKVYRSSAMYEADYYKTVITVNWDADIDN